MPQATTDEQEFNLAKLLKDVDKNGPQILTAIKGNQVVLTTATGFQKIREKLREDTGTIFSLAAEKSDLIGQNAVLLNTLVYVLMAFNGVAANGPAIFDIIGKLGITPGSDISAKTIVMKLIANTGLLTSIMDNIRVIGAGFDASCITKINADALLPILDQVNFDFSNYRNLILAAQQFNNGLEKIPENV